jgi:hypothetical protein
MWYRKFLIGYIIKLSHVYNYTLNNKQINTAAEVDYKNVSFKVRSTCKVALTPSITYKSSYPFTLLPAHMEKCYQLGVSSFKEKLVSMRHS